MHSRISWIGDYDEQQNVYFKRQTTFNKYILKGVKRWG
jgi:hypothetical protein